MVYTKAADSHCSVEKRVYSTISLDGYSPSFPTIMCFSCFFSTQLVWNDPQATYQK